jgi:serine/threonine protein phosphatase 1
MVNEALKTAPAWVAPGTRIFAIGDVHGCAGRLADLHRLVAADLAAEPVARPVIVHLGDYIDRGHDSAEVVRMLSSGPVLPGVPTINLRGNHEQMMLAALTGAPHRIEHWLDNNAEATLRSWGTSSRRPVAEWRAVLTPLDHAFLNGLPLHHQIDGYLFVHAGLRPGIPLDQQTEEDMLWIRDDFLDWHGTILPEQPRLAIVHGHTPEPRPTVADNRIGIDTGAVKGGALTCAVLEGRTVRFLFA